MKKSILLPALLLAALSTEAQRFQRYFTPTTVNPGSEELRSGTDNSLMPGTAAVGAFQPTAGFSSARFVRLNDDGSPAVNLSIQVKATAAAPVEVCQANSITERLLPTSIIPQNYAVAGRVGSGASTDALFFSANSGGAISAVRRLNFGVNSQDQAFCVRNAPNNPDRFLICGNTVEAAAPNNSNVFLSMVSGTGALSYSRAFRITGANNLRISVAGVSMATDAANRIVWVVGKGTSVSGGIATNYGMLMKFDETTGNLLATYSYSATNLAASRIREFKSIIRLSTGEFMILGSVTALGGTGLGSGISGDILMKMNLSGAAPVNVFQRMYNFNMGAAGTAAQINGNEVIELPSTVGSPMYAVCGSFGFNGNKATYMVDNLGNPVSANLYETIVTGNLFSIVRSNDAVLSNNLVAFGSGKSGLNNRSYATKMDMGLGTITTTSCPMTSINKYNQIVVANFSPCNQAGYTGTITSNVAQTSSHLSALCALDVAAGGGREAVSSEEEINQPDFKRLSMYPNPSNGSETLTLEINTLLNEAQVEVIDMMGRKILSETKTFEAGNASITLAINNLQKGNFLIRVVNAEGIRVQRFSKD
jgi:hypothetical protein